METGSLCADGGAALCSPDFNEGNSVPEHRPWGNAGDRTVGKEQENGLFNYFFGRRCHLRGGADRHGPTQNFFLGGLWSFLYAWERYLLKCVPLYEPALLTGQRPEPRFLLIGFGHLLFKGVKEAVDSQGLCGNLLRWGWNRQRWESLER